MNKRVVVLSGIVVVAACSRLLPHPPNVTPIAAMALFGGAFLTDRRLAYLLPLAAMLLGDVVLGITVYGRAVLFSQPVVYGCMLATVALGRLVRNRRSALNVGCIAVASSLLFFVVTNFSVWALGSLYPRRLTGLSACYVAAIPFFRNSLAGDLAFTAALFGGFAVLETFIGAIRENRGAAVA